MSQTYKFLVVHLRDGGTETIPVGRGYKVPNLGELKWFIVDAVDKSQVQIPVADITKLHLKAA